eukprot:14900706-Ditylum_brightwellii.AAC.1
MGKGGRSEPITNGPSKRVNEDDVWVSPYNPLDAKAPTLPSKGEIKAVIPKECFERSYMHSMYFVFRDTAWAVAL